MHCARVVGMRWISSLGLACVFTFGKWGPRIFTGSPAARRSAMDWLGQADAFFRDAWSPTLIIIGLGGLVGIWIVAPIARVLVDKWFGAKTREFNVQFANEHHQRARNNFAWFLEAAYRKDSHSSLELSLYDALTKVKFPTDFPREDLRIHEYAKTIKWPDTHSEAVFIFIKKQFLDMLQRAENDIHALSDRYGNLADLVRITGKFWDDWAHEILGGKLRYGSVAAQIRANQPAIIALTLSELAIAAEFSWDPGPGRTYLFRLALGREHIEPRSFWKRLRFW